MNTTTLSQNYIYLSDTLIRKDHVSMVAWNEDSISIELLNGKEHLFCFEKNTELIQSLLAVLNEVPIIFSISDIGAKQQ